MDWCGELCFSARFSMFFTCALFQVDQRGILNMPFFGLNKPLSGREGKSKIGQLEELNFLLCAELWGGRGKRTVFSKFWGLCAGGLRPLQLFGPNLRSILLFDYRRHVCLVVGFRVAHELSNLG